jgi:putative membrane protein
MIVRPRPRLIELFTLFRLSIVARIAPQILTITLCATAVTALAQVHPAFFRSLSPAPFTLLGIALSIFLGFRNNVCYDRWWEARRQLGALIGEARSLARLTLTTSGGDTPRRQRAVRAIIAYVYALMSHLRGEPASPEVSRYLANPHASSRNLPDALLRHLAAEYAAMLAVHEFGEPIYQRIDERLSAFAAIQAACERIRSTPTPFTYTLLLHRTAYAFCFLLGGPRIYAVGVLA